ncbi:MAG: hypothetical protein R2747_08170 [Pyrinomonadaceae bacterium]
MNKKLLGAAVLVWTFLLTGCSLDYKLQVANYTSEPLTVTYRLRENGRFQEPQAAGLDNSGTGGELKALSAEAYTTDQTKRERTVKIQPRQMVILETGPWNPDSEKGMMQTVEITVEGVNGRVNYSGGKFYQSFNKDDSNIYTIEYR